MVCVLLLSGMALPAQGYKTEWGDCALDISSGKQTVTKDDIPALLERLQDMNWPGSRLIADFLPRFGHDLIEPIRIVLKSGDDVWIYWVLGSFADEFDENFWGVLKLELEKIASIWNAEETHVHALYILARNKLMTAPAVMRLLKEFESEKHIDAHDRERIEVLLG